MCKKGRMFRLLTADEIVARVASYSAKGASLLLYKTARTDIALLNETVGPLNWKKSHDIVNGFVTCTLSIWDDEKKEWISKTDVGTEDNAAKDKDSTADDQDKADDKNKNGKDANSNLATKSKYSDSLKRAGFCWGLGIELYTAPFIWVPASKGGNKNLKATVSEIGYDENDRINRLVLTDRNGNVIYSFGTQTPAKPAAVNDNSDLVAKLRAKLEEKRVPEKFVTDAYKVDALEKVSASAVATMLTPAGIAKIVNSYNKKMQDEREKNKQFDLFSNLPDELPYD